MKTPKITVKNVAADDLDPLAKNFPDRAFQDFARYLQQADREECLFLTAQTNGAPVGYCLVYWQSSFNGFKEKNAPEIVDLIVMPAHRQKGFASNLLEGIENILINKGITHVGLTVADDNTAGRALYTARGYTQTAGTHPDNSATLMLVKNLLA